MRLAINYHFSCLWDPDVELLCRVGVIANENTLPSLSEFRFRSFLIRNVNKHKVIENANMYKTLSMVHLGFFKNWFSAVLTSCKQSTL